MKIAEIFDQLTYGELAQIHIGGADVGEIDEDNYPKMLAHINLGLIALYKRFSLKTGKLTIALQPSRYTYPLRSAYAVSSTGSTEPVKYILDSVGDPFINDINKVEVVATELDKELALNNMADPYSIATPTSTSLYVPSVIVDGSPDLPDWLKTKKLLVTYRASHPALVYTDQFDPLVDEIELPYSHLEPLLYYVASRINNPIGMVNEFHAGNSYAAKYEKACQELEGKSLQVDQGAQYDRLLRNGWV